MVISLNGCMPRVEYVKWLIKFDSLYVLSSVRCKSGGEIALSQHPAHTTQHSDTKCVVNVVNLLIYFLFPSLTHDPIYKF